MDTAQASAGDVTVGSDKSFGLTFAAVGLVVGVVRTFRHGPVAGGPWLVAAAVFLAIALTRPSTLHSLNLIWFRFGLLLNRITSPIVFSLIFALAVVPTALVARLFGKRPLALRIDRQNRPSSYWIPSVKPPADSSMANQF